MRLIFFLVLTAATSSLAYNCVYKLSEAEYSCTLENLDPSDSTFDSTTGHHDELTSENVTAVYGNALSGLMQTLDGTILNEFKNVKKFEFESLQVELLSDPFESCDELEVLSLKGNSLKTFEEILLQNCKKLKTLNLSENLLESLGVKDMPLLEVLDANSNKLTSSLVQLEALDSLRDLNLLHNAINSTDFLKNLPNLEVLNLHLNKIEKLSQNSFAGAKNLKLLTLSANEMAEVHPKAFDKLENLIKLDLSTNKLKYLSFATFFHIRNLTDLLLCHNELETVPDFSWLEKLQTLDLASNLIQFGSFESLHQLVNLDLSNNLIAQLPDKTFASLYHVKSLNISGNVLTVLSLVSFGQNKHLTELNVRSNSIRAIQRNFGSHFPNLVKFDAFGNSCVRGANDFSVCYQNFDEIFNPTTSITEEIAPPTTAEPEADLTSKDLIIIMIVIVAMASLLLALIFWIHDLLLVKERREAVKQGTAKEIDKKLPDYERF